MSWSLDCLLSCRPSLSLLVLLIVDTRQPAVGQSCHPRMEASLKEISVVISLVPFPIWRVSQAEGLA